MGADQEKPGVSRRAGPRSSRRGEASAGGRMRRVSASLGNRGVGWAAGPHRGWPHGVKADERDVAAGFGGRWPVEGETEGAGSALSRLGVAQSEKYARTQLNIHESTILPYDIYQLKSRDPLFLKSRHVLDPIYLPIKKSVDILAFYSSEASF